MIECADQLGLTTVSTYLLGGELAGLVTTGSVKGMLIGAVSGAAFAGIGNAFSANAGAGFGSGLRLSKTLGVSARALKIGAHALAGGARSVLSGGKFKAGFMAAGFTEAASPAISFAGDHGGIAAEYTAAGVVGGVGSKLGGGSFEDGAVTGIFVQAFNHHAHKNSCDKTDDNYHEYEYSSRICSTSSSSCTVDSVWNSLKNNSGSRGQPT